MSTSDGISTNDWDIVHELAVEVVNATEEEHDKRRTALVNYLAQLEKKYGERPSILATWADYIDNSDGKQQLLVRAYTLAHARQDSLNERETAHSLAKLHIETLKDSSEGIKWLDSLKKHLDENDDLDLREEYERLLRAVRLLEEE
jgi:hypothetical protein